MQADDIGVLLAQKTWPKREPEQIRNSNAAQLAGGKDLVDAVDLSSLPSTDPVSFPMVRQSFSYREQIAAFTAKGTMAYSGEDGSTIFVDFSIQSVTKKVRFEMVQAADAAVYETDDDGGPSHAYLGPTATAGRIVEHAKGLLNKFRAMEGNDPERLGAFLRKLIDAIRRGFYGLDDILGTRSDRVGDLVKETFQRVMDGMSALGNEVDGKQQVRRLVYEKEISYTTARVDVSVVV